MSIEVSPNIFEFDVRGISKRLRHPAIFGALESLGQGDVMRFVNDHDPVPLLRQIQQRYQEQVHFEYMQRDEEAVVIDFTVHPREQAATGAENEAAAPATGGCGGGHGGCGCQGS